MRLEHLGHYVLDTAFNGKDAIIKTGKTNPDLVLMDIQLNGEMDGIDTAKQIHELYNIPFIYLTGSHNKIIIERAKQTEPSGYIYKPFNDSEIQNAIDNATLQK
ncbi:response regulator [Methanobacterium sp. VT]|uniref:Response regulator n=2 Tax=Methanobacterium spitsbergense TaxID=2874285 RepID=A0A8T5USX8_9EURY|nr:response regulator [Methanobacterium spitsbergense]